MSLLSSNRAPEIDTKLWVFFLSPMLAYAVDNGIKNAPAADAVVRQRAAAGGNRRRRGSVCPGADPHRRGRAADSRTRTPWMAGRNPRRHLLVRYACQGLLLRS